jgi:hypothetical protein
MAAGAMRTVRAAQLLRQTRTLTRITGAKTLSVPGVGQRRGQSTVADIHDAPQTGLQSGIQTGMELLRGRVLMVGSLLAGRTPMGPSGGPMARYEMLIQQGRLREDSHQKGTHLPVRYSGQS